MHLSNTTASTVITAPALALLAITVLASGCVPVDDTDANLDNCVEVAKEVTEDTTLQGCVLAPNGLSVTEDTLLTVAPGTRIVFGADTSLIAYDGGKLNAVGTSDEPIVLTGEEEIPSFWVGVKFTGTNSTDNALNHVTIEYAGQTASGFSGTEAAALDLNDWSGPVRVSVDNTTIRDSDEFGIRVGDGVTITSFDGNTLTGNKHAGLASPTGAGQLSANSTWAENTNNIVEISGIEVVGQVTWAALDGADYLVRDRMGISGEDADHRLTIDAGATVAFDQNAGIVAFRGGVLTARGTADAPIIFTGKEQTAGYWLGLHYNSTNSTDNVLEHVTIEYGGGDGWSSGYSGSSPANLLLNNWGGPVRLTLNNAIIRGSGSAAVHVREAANDIVIDGCSNITYENNAGAEISPNGATCPQ
jgi:hypothetical protein